ncbi:hypothetical protein CAOG_06912 [Capsaspora owczarzaki ATCC 30864]|uniref:N-acetyltransferase domain-containing protein n=1 Tax=Capsaspora owczarzaki (strain ATCC 30864) TaxID=595528 RepID=A0A0D2WW34_CAPO3|nr:hypothetical protein CAOG_06912 [Capsaspora owczarzaki ATCC 30864]KJE96613.1 hypothetical protein CAOG_006912 [Capsaspora owczarzaki ATCC 30864]|eukprot:XP_004344533.1 hypothetical protein CAOG_06912 [Capsaspora owczarzaki ATCC 30864]
MLATVAPVDVHLARLVFLRATLLADHAPVAHASQSTLAQAVHRAATATPAAAAASTTSTAAADALHVGAFLLPAGTARPNLHALAAAAPSLLHEIARAVTSTAHTSSSNASLASIAARVDALVAPAGLVGAGSIARQPLPSGLGAQGQGAQATNSNSSDAWRLCHIAVLPANRENGYGSNVVRALRRHVETKDGKYMWSTSDLDIFWETMGFEDAGAHPIDGTSQNVILTDIVKSFSCPSAFC